MYDLRPNAQRAKTAILLIWIALATDAVSIIVDILNYNLLVKAGHGYRISMEESTITQIQYFVVAALAFIVGVVSAITFIMWFRRAYYNLHLRVKRLRFDEGWAAGAWFVPIINLGRPVRIMSELYKETDKLFKKKLPGYEGVFTSTYITLWWTLWLLSGLVGRISYSVTRSAESISELKDATIISLVVSAIGIILAVVTVKVIKDYAAMEEKLPDVPVDETMPQQGYNTAFYPRQQ